MNDPALTSARSDPSQGTRPSPPSPTASSSAFPSFQRSWFHTREGRRYGIEIGLIIVVKLALLAALWLVVIHPWPRPATAPAAAVQQFYMPAPAARHD